MQPLIDDAEFRSAMASFAASVTVVTTQAEDGTPYGLTATAFSSVCRTPPTCLVCVGDDAEAAPVVARTGRFAVNVLSQDQVELSLRFATTGADKFGPTAHVPGPALGLPLLRDALAVFECVVSGQHRAGDHVVFFGELRSVAVREGAPLVYFRGRYADLVPRP
jgi:flavin reductase (DIM6/NTAB) family NADH-FMN oxidoreductase RutF